MASLGARIVRAGNDPNVCRSLLSSLEMLLAGRRLRFMEVCGTHTVSIFQSGLRSLLPSNVIHVSGPGCPVCVTHESELAMLLEAALLPDVIVASFGDLLRVPDADGDSLNHARARGAQIEVVYSPLDAVELARSRPDKIVVFVGIGFETTAPAVAAAILAARSTGCANFCVLSMHKLIAPALRAIIHDQEDAIDAFLLPGHVATITGLDPFRFIGSEYKKIGVVGGFEPADILQALCVMAGHISNGTSAVENGYRRAVADEGNPHARGIMNRVFKTSDAAWRGLGLIPASGLVIRSEFSAFDAARRLNLAQPAASVPKGCLCGALLKGKIEPPQCPMFGTKCTPATPVGPCMVSSEGSCSAWYRYGKI